MPPTEIRGRTRNLIREEDDDGVYWWRLESPNAICTSMGVI